jgi:exopolysaccharide/PEP-CTERM locus tyrosine autokinase
VGKIFDALEKSKKKDSTSVVTNETLNPVLNVQTESQEAFFDKTASLKKNKQATIFSNKAHANDEEGGRQRHVIPFDGTEVLYDSNNIDINLVALLKPQSIEAEQFKMLRTNLLFPASGEPPRSLIVTSAVPGEGKSFVTANLAISIAQSLQEHVLIIDCDLRKSSVHKQFGLGDVPGLSEHLSNGTSLSSLLLKTNLDRLSILPGGKPPPNPAELLSSQQMSKLLEELKDRYSDRYIVIDTPPPKMTAETSALSRQVDGILLVVEYGKTPREMVADLLKMMGKEKILGVVFNKIDMKLSSYYGYGKYIKYGKYYAS